MWLLAFPGWKELLKGVDERLFQTRDASPYRVKVLLVGGVPRPLLRFSRLCCTSVSYAGCLSPSSRLVDRGNAS